MKVCNKCGSEKPMSAYYNTPNTKDGKQGTCKVCHYFNYLSKRAKYRSCTNCGVENINYVGTKNYCTNCLADIRREAVREKVSGICVKMSLIERKSKKVHTCNKCNVKKPKAEFPKERATICKSCRTKQRKAWSKRNPERDRAAYERHKNTDKYKLTIARRDRKRQQKAIEGKKVAIEYGYCIECGEWYVNSKKWKCSGCNMCKACYKKEEGKRLYYERYRVAQSDCKMCGITFDKEPGTKPMYCEDCKQKAEIIQKRKKRQYNKARRRASTIGRVAYDPYDVFKRAKWRCAICSVKVQKKDIYADNAAEIDHIVPIAKGGKDIPSNVQCLCRRCNIEKSDKLIGQPSLFSQPKRMAG